MLKLKTAWWFLKNPKYLPQVFQVLRRKKYKALENTREEATRWCENHCISQAQALEKLTGTKDFQGLADLFPVIMKEAYQRESDAPVKMGGAGAISFIYQLIKWSNASRIMETGVAYGWSSLAILLAIKDDEEAKLISNDMPYISMDNEDFVGCVIPENLKEKWDLQRLPDVKGIPLALKKSNNSIDFCHYDSDKSYTGRMWATPLLWKALKKDCFLMVDDINDNLAFKHFCQSVDRTPVIIREAGKYAGVIVK